MSVQEQCVTPICIQRDGLSLICGVLHNLICSFRNRKHTFSVMPILCVYIFLPLVWTLLYSDCACFSCLPGHLPADVDIETGVRRGRKAVRRQKVSLILTPSHKRHPLRPGLCQKLDIICGSFLTMDSGTPTDDCSSFVWVVLLFF